jgi:hypothetical protein
MWLPTYGTCQINATRSLAAALSSERPVTGEETLFESALPEDLKTLREALAAR